ncbi:hypothetical protein NDU88_004311 [Pleurodeles waltl]|uniref:Uncharacterized protein n=1 Tax=Pleurodeles waltl TaxID=8319 RepID=A0AAV7V1F6_PLEWA|nr:hypothetical protein NDU88_004311 [Pleurodeles waltl]
MATYNMRDLPPNPEEKDFVQAYENVREKYKGTLPGPGTQRFPAAPDVRFHQMVFNEGRTLAWVASDALLAGGDASWRLVGLPEVVCKCVSFDALHCMFEVFCGKLFHAKQDAMSWSQETCYNC